MKTVLITGGSSGIGLEFVKIFVKDGYKVVVASRSKQMPSNDLSLNAVTYFQFDLSKPQSADKLTSELKKQKISVDVLVNNAGFGDYGPFVESDIKKQQSMIQLNITTLTTLTHNLLPSIIKNKGKILNIASTAAFVPGPYMSVYYATKHYVLAFSEALSAELSDKGVTVTALCPGPTDSGFKKSANIKSGTLFSGSLPSARKVAEYGYSSLNNGKQVAVHGLRNKVITSFIKFIPRSLALRLSKRNNFNGS